MKPRKATVCTGRVARKVKASVLSLALLKSSSEPATSPEGRNCDIAPRASYLANTFGEHIVIPLSINKRTGAAAEFVSRLLELLLLLDGHRSCVVARK